MEDAARLAVVEQNAKDHTLFLTTLEKLLDFIGDILKSPQDNERRVFKNLSEKSLCIAGFQDYLNYVGFEIVSGTVRYPKHQSLEKLKTAKEAIERKLNFLNGYTKHSIKQVEVPSTSKSSIPQCKLPHLNVLKTSNEFLLRLQSDFNKVLNYEDPELQRQAREKIPVVTLQIRAMERVRAYQEKMKKGEIKGDELTFEMALMSELVSWFKNNFFEWVDKPACPCGGTTENLENTTLTIKRETCRLEIYKCTTCNRLVNFPRFNNPGTLLKTRRGRCGEWANCFCLMCRALGYETRFVYDTTDHVWTEVFDFQKNKWVHVDTGEEHLDRPLTYEHGWGKKLEYVIAFSKDDLQDVTWRYSSHHKEVMQRRLMCSEEELIETISLLREERQKGLSESRKKYLAKRCLQELVQLMVERKPSDYENQGRITGSLEWRKARGELGAAPSHIFKLPSQGIYILQYYPSIDSYTVSGEDGREQEFKQEIIGWDKGVFQYENIFRKEEKDWKMVYLAREDGESKGFITWTIAVEQTDIAIETITVLQTSKLYENGLIEWSIQYDDGQLKSITLDDGPKIFIQKCSKFCLRAELSGGVGNVAFQHAQLFRQPLDCNTSALDITVNVRKL